MDKEKHKSISKLQRYKGVIKNGLFLFGIRNRLAKAGLDIEPYYWVQEEVVPCKLPEVKGGASGFVVKEIGLKEIEVLRSFQSDREFYELIKGIENGQLCFGLEHNGDLAAYTFVELKDFEFKGRKFKLKAHEAYLLNMWTFHAYRGRNLAPYLRCQTYKILKEQGRDVKYSITNYFNKSSAKFKNKLNSKNLSLHLSIVLFGKHTWNFKMKTYK
ncbi:hypothetical protein ACFFU9_06470 [Mariniflexile ostreae]|uniref:N-acetyltransferase domain-containing protein n=1 Tax=Mariniflexile ostreae TaxID=1520892 RepID=A0ABV5FAD8_9FLAO